MFQRYTSNSSWKMFKLSIWTYVLPKFFIAILHDLKSTILHRRRAYKTYSVVKKKQIWNFLLRKFAFLRKKTWDLREDHLFCKYETGKRTFQWGECKLQGLNKIISPNITYALIFYVEPLTLFQHDSKPNPQPRIMYFAVYMS